MTQDKKTTKNPLARPISKLAVVAGVIASMAFPVFAQDGTGPMPDNAEARSYGGGWNCDLGYRVEGAECLALDIPENAYATGRSYGLGWACRRGYEEAEGTSCEAIPVPENAFLRSSGYNWQCDRGYQQNRETCVPIVLPDHAYLNDDTSDSGWTCERGYEQVNNTCVALDLPANAHLDRSGNRWRCDRSFQLSNEECVLGR